MFLQKKFHVCYSQEFLDNENEKFHYFIHNVSGQDLNSRIFFYLFFTMLVEKKYFQLYYFYNFFFSNNILLLFNKELINYLLIKLQNEVELSLFIIKRGFLFNSSNFILSSKPFFHRKNLSNINYFNSIYNNSDNMLRLVMNNIHFYNTLELFKKNEIRYYVN
jgi:hypothetical protein